MIALMPFPTRGRASPIAIRGPINHIKAISPNIPRMTHKEREPKKYKIFFMFVFPFKFNYSRGQLYIHMYLPAIRSVILILSWGSVFRNNGFSSQFRTICIRCKQCYFNSTVFSFIFRGVVRRNRIGRTAAF